MAVALDPAQDQAVGQRRLLHVLPGASRLRPFGVTARAVVQFARHHHGCAGNLQQLLRHRTDDHAFDAAAVVRADDDHVGLHIARTAVDRARRRANADVPVRLDVRLAGVLDLREH